MTCTRGPCARRTGSAWGVAAPPSLLQPAAPAAACAAGVHYCPAPVALHRPALVHPRPRLAPAAPPRPPVGGESGEGNGGAEAVPPPSCCLPLPVPLPCSAVGGGGGCPGRRQCAHYRGKNVAHGTRMISYGRTGGIHGISVCLNGRLRTHPKIKTDANGRTPKLKRTQTDAPNLEKHVIAHNTPRALTTCAICKEALGTSSPPQWWWCLHGVKELEPMVLPQRTPSQSVEQHGHQDSCPCQPTFPIRVWKWWHRFSKCECLFVFGFPLKETIIRVMANSCNNVPRIQRDPRGTLHPCEPPGMEILANMSCQYTMPEKRWQKNAWRPSSVATFILKLWFMTKCNGLTVPGNVKPVYISYYPLNHRRGCHAGPRHSMWPAIIRAQTHPKRKNGHKRTHPKIKTGANGHTQNSKRTQTDGYPYQNGR